MKKIQVCLEDDEFSFCQNLAVKEDRPISAMIRIMIKDYKNKKLPLSQNNIYPPKQKKVLCRCGLDSKKEFGDYCSAYCKDIDAKHTMDSADDF